MNELRESVRAMTLTLCTHQLCCVRSLSRVSSMITHESANVNVHEAIMLAYESFIVTLVVGTPHAILGGYPKPP
jgi:hypothetical protein